MAGDQEAGLAFVAFLKAAKVPECLWESLLENIENGTVGCDDAIEVSESGKSGPLNKVLRVANERRICNDQENHLMNQWVFWCNNLTLVQGLRRQDASCAAIAKTDLLPATSVFILPNSVAVTRQEVKQLLADSREFRASCAKHIATEEGGPLDLKIP
jgi:hypothetical protein